MPDNLKDGFHLAKSRSSEPGSDPALSYTKRKYFAVVGTISLVMDAKLPAINRYADFSRSNLVDFLFKVLLIDSLA